MTDLDPKPQADDALVDLLIQQIAWELSPAERKQLAVLSDAVTPGLQRGLECAAGAVVLAAARADAAEPLPETLRARIDRDAAAYFALPKVIQLDSYRPAAAAIPSYSAWWVAAACLVLAAVGWLRPPPSAPPVALVSAPPPTSMQQRAALLSGPATLTLPLGGTKDPAGSGVSGDVVWDPVAQRGFIRFVGLAPNDARRQQYQVWIFDAERDERYPVDGGVFDIPAGQAEVLVPIQSRVPVHTAKLFAITLEKAGGVVVSARERIVALAQAT